MAAKQFVEVTVSIPVETCDAVWDGKTKSPADMKSTDVTTLTEAVFEQIRLAGPYFKINIATFGSTFELWIAQDWEMAKVWHELDRIHGIKRGDRKMSWDGHELHEEFDFDNVSFCPLFVIPAPG